jgi:hypothetical protein
MQFGRHAAWVVALALLGLGGLPVPAGATFHLMSIREVYPGSGGAPGAEYVELQMYSSGQNFVKGHSVTFYNAAGGEIVSEPFPQDVPNGQNQRTVLMGTTAAEGQFGVAVDAPMAPERLEPAGGAVCFESIDCVSWGSFAGSLPSAGTPAAAIPDGMALRRTIAPGCPTLLESQDDHNNSALDFSPVFPAPRPNSATPSEQACAGAGAGQSAGGTPQTSFKRKPPKRTTDRTPTFRFASDEADSTFQCKLDGKPYRRCRSPFTTKRLALGRHTFRVRARDSSGLLDPSPATYAFKVIARR